MTAARRRLQSPTGTVLWECSTPNGDPSTFHATEQEAANRAAFHKGAVVFPRIVDTTEEQIA